MAGANHARRPLAITISLDYIGCLAMSAGDACYMLSKTVTGLGDTVRAAEEAADEQAQTELFALGWQPPLSGSLREVALQLAASQGVEILHVGQPFRLELGERTVSGTPADEAPLVAASVLVADEQPGFLTRYATSALEEDKAEVFAFLMARPGEMARRMGSDRVLSAKAQGVREIVADLDPAMDASFWARVAKRRAPL